MNNKFFIYIICILFFSCSSQIQDKELSEIQIKKINSIHQTFEEVYPISIEETILNFKQDLDTDKEINLWIKMKETFITVNQEKGYNSISQKKEVFKLILMRTMMSKEEVKNNLELKLLNMKDIEYILRLFESKVMF